MTEKLFQSIAAGCIPIYWGSYNQPETEVINRDAVLFWEVGGDNSQMLQMVEEMNDDDKKYIEFFAQSRLKESAAEYVIGVFNQFEERVKKLFF